MNRNRMILLFSLLLALPAFAQTHKGISFQGVIKLPSGEFPTRSGVSVTAQILAPNNCILREEQFSGVNLSNGYINLAIGTGNTVAHDPGLTMKQVMDNSATTPGLTCLNVDGTVNSALTAYNPSGSSGLRKLRVSLTLDSTAVVADFNMRAMAYALNSEVADDSRTLAGKSAHQFIQTSTAVTQSALEGLFANTSLGNILAGSYNAPTASSAVTAQGLDSSYVVPLTQGGTGATSATAARTALGLGPLATLATSGTPDGTKYLRDDGQWSAVVGGVSSVAGRTGAITLSASDISNFNTAADARITASSSVSGAFQSATTLSGDLSGTLPSPTVEKIKNQTVSAAGSAAGQVLRYAGSNTWTPAFISMFDLRSTTTGAQAFGGVGCLASQTLTWTAASDNLSCTDIAIASSKVSGLAASATTDTTSATNITSGTLNKARLPAAVTDNLWAGAFIAGNIYRESGNVGVGIEPSAKLDVNGVINVNNNKITNVATPTNPADVATKAYVDAAGGVGDKELTAVVHTTNSFPACGAGTSAIACLRGNSGTYQAASGKFTTTKTKYFSSAGYTLVATVETSGNTGIMTAYINGNYISGVQMYNSYYAYYYDWGLCFCKEN